MCNTLLHGIDITFISISDKIFMSEKYKIYVFGVCVCIGARPFQSV